jgi:hypothetical protein
VSGSSRTCGKLGGVWKAAAVWKSTLLQLELDYQESTIVIPVPYNCSNEAIIVPEGEETAPRIDHALESRYMQLRSIIGTHEILI